MRSFRIYIDSSCDLSTEYINENNITVIPMMYSLDDKDHPDGRWRDISGDNFYKALKNGGVAKTTQVNPGTFAEYFGECAAQGEDLICITLSSGLSGSYNNAVSAAEDVSNHYPDRGIYVIDSINATGGHGLLAALAVDKGGEGLSAKDTAKWLNERKHSVYAVFTVDDLNFLHRGGRLSKLSAVAGSLLSVKPLLWVTPDGHLQLKDKVRGRKAALETLLSQMKRCINPGDNPGLVIITHCGCEDDANKLADLIKESYNGASTMVVTMGPVIGAHTGPGAVAMFFESNMTREEYDKKYYSKN